MKFKLPSLARLNIPAEEWEDPTLDLANTDARVARMYSDELLSSYKPGAFDELVRRFTCFPSGGNDSMVTETGLSWISVCAHHLLPIAGDADIAYVPGPKIIGASKIPRVVSFFAAQLQIQERLARQVADFIYQYAEAKFVVVMLTATHHCMASRGVKQANAKMITTAIRPSPGGEDDELLRGVLNEFYQQISLTRK